MRTPTFTASLLVALLWISPVVQADDLKSISQQAEQGQHAQALERLNAHLSAHPGDVQGQFLKGVILAEQGKSADAIRIFSDLTTQHPELPEPHNNLAVLYAEQGQYEKARRALELAIKTHPSYATAHENLGDVYAKMATDAYDKALQLDRNNPSTQTKLSMVKELFSGAPRPQAAVAKVDVPVRTTVVPVAVALVKAPVVATEQPKPPVAETRKPPKETKEAVDAPAVPDKQALTEAQSSAVEETVRGWAKAWSAQDVAGYLGYYGAGFKVLGGESRQAWEKSRRERIKAPASIRVELSAIKVRMGDDGRATASFRQSYRAGTVAKRTSKSLVLKKGGSKWYIEQELTDR